MKIINLTPHPITFCLPGRVDTTYPSFGIAHVYYDRERTAQAVKGIPVYRRLGSRIEGLPKPKPDTIYVTSRRAAEVAWVQGRHDVYALSGPVFTKAKDGELIGYRSLDRNPYPKKTCGNCEHLYSPQDDPADTRSPDLRCRIDDITSIAVDTPGCEFWQKRQEELLQGVPSDY